MFWRIAAGLLRGLLNLAISASFAIKSALGLRARPADRPAATPVSGYEPEFEQENSDTMDYSLPPGLVDRHKQDNPDES